MRLFVALPVPVPARDAVLAAVAELRHDDRLSWTRPDGWHVTLAFVGEVDDPDAVVDATRAGVAAAGTGPVTLTTAGAETLARRTALALALADDPTGAVGRLGASVQEALAEAGVDVPRRRVRPHLTLGRSRRRRPVPAGIVDAVEVPPVAWTASHVEVVRSLLGDGPATYRSVATVELARS